jgi:hypothetical protein
VRVTGIHFQNEKLSRKKTIKVLAVSFSGALDARPAQRLGAYQLATLGKARKGGLPPATPVPLLAAVYNPTADTVTLTPLRTITSSTLRLTITTNEILDARGRPIDGTQGSAFVATFGKSGISLASATPELISAAAVDALRSDGLEATRDWLRRDP